MAKAAKKPGDGQAKKFRELARELDADPDESRFNERLGKIAQHKVQKSAGSGRASKKKPGD